jgi:hypothetical protein
MQKKSFSTHDKEEILQVNLLYFFFSHEVIPGAAPDSHSRRQKRGLLTLLVHKQQTDAFKDTDKQTELDDFNRVEWDGKV